MPALHTGSFLSSPLACRLHVLGFLCWGSKNERLGARGSCAKQRRRVTITPPGDLGWPGFLRTVRRATQILNTMRLFSLHDGLAMESRIHHSGVTCIIKASVYRYIYIYIYIYIYKRVYIYIYISLLKFPCGASEAAGHFVVAGTSKTP